jgi:hypothetical protein
MVTWRIGRPRRSAVTIVCAVVVPMPMSLPASTTVACPFWSSVMRAAPPGKRWCG